MRLVIVVTTLVLCGVGLIFASGLPTHKVQLGDNVTLTCPNFCNSSSQVAWFRINQQPKNIMKPVKLGNAKNNGRFSNRRVEMRSNHNTTSFTITQVNSSDSGLYFCGCLIEVNNNPVTVYFVHLKVQGSLGKTKTDQNDRTTDMFMIQHMTKSVILGSVIIFALIIIIICLVVRIKKIERGRAEEQSGHQTEPQGKEVDYTSVYFRPKRECVPRPLSEGRDIDLAVYSNIRQDVKAEAETRSVI